MNIDLILYIIALILVGLAALNASSGGRVHFGWLGVFVFGLTLVI